MKQIHLSSKHCLLLVVLISFITTFPWLGMSLFNTKGEPREALVPQSMLRTGNYILPERFGDVVATKPPFTHWMMAGLAHLNGGEVNETTTRLPSAIAAFALTIIFFLFLAKESNSKQAMLSALLLISTIDFHRTAMTSRVDMVLTTFIILSFIAFYRWEKKDLKGYPMLLMLFMSCATLTKGPVGIVLPCFIFFTYAMTNGRNFFAVCIAMMKVALPALILPAMWYLAAYQQGGEEFMNVVLEENIGRMTGKMTYESHNNPFFYPLLYTIVGTMPWMILALLSLIPFKFTRKPIASVWTKFKTLPGIDRFNLIAMCCVIFFYSIPSSKRAVYQLPAYPFVAYFLAKLYFYVEEYRPALLRYVSYFFAAITAIIIIGLVGIYLAPLPANNIIDPLKANSSAWGVIVFLSIVLILCVRNLNSNKEASYITIVLALFFSIQISLDASILPSIKNSESMKPFAEKINSAYKGKEIHAINATLWQMNYYLDQKLMVEEDKNKFVDGELLLIGEKQANKLIEEHPNLQLQTLERSDIKSTDIRDYVLLVSIRKD